MRFLLSLCSENLFTQYTPSASLKFSCIFAFMSKKERCYIAIDLKSFYASVECVERGLNPLDTNLVVADGARTDKTICLAVTPSLKAYGISGRPRLFEVVERVKEVNAERRRFEAYPKGMNPRDLHRCSFSDKELKADPTLDLDYVVAPPRMALYLEYSRRIHDIYLKYIAPEDIHVYSVDEVFIDATDYLESYRMTGHELAIQMIRDVLQQTGITATAGIGTNLYLSKVAMDIVAKRMPADSDGVRIAELDEMSYRRTLWDHRPLTDFWRVGRGTAKKLEMHSIRTMGDLARRSLTDEELLYRLFGVNAELLIDHAWGWEPCTMEYIKSYRPESNSFSRGQVLSEPYSFEKARVVVQEMADAMALLLVEKHLVTDQLVLSVGYDSTNVANSSAIPYAGSISTDHYGRKVPKSAHGSVNLPSPGSSSRIMTEALLGLYDRIVSHNFSIRRLNLTANHVVPRTVALLDAVPEQLDLFTDYQAVEELRREEEARLEKEQRVQETLVQIKQRFGKNAILKGLNFEDGATAIERNKQIGGHKA